MNNRICRKVSMKIAVEQEQLWGTRSQGFSATDSAQLSCG